jgi:nucleotide-binding universal stress UspA family protein
MFHNILVPVDGSSDADQALTQAIDLAECEHASLTLLTIVVLPSAASASRSSTAPVALRSAST